MCDFDTYKNNDQLYIDEVLSDKTLDSALDASNASIVITQKPTAKTPTYNGSAQELVNAGTATGGQIQYAVTTTDAAPTSGWDTSIPTRTDAGTYYVWYKAGGNDSAAGKVSVTISKANPSVTAPTAKKDLTYTKTPQPLVNDGNAIGGTMNYAIGTSSMATGSYSTSIPTATDAGSYYVWYKVIGDANHNDSTPGNVPASIAPHTIGVNWPDAEERFFEHDGESHVLAATATGLFSDDSCTVTVSGEKTNTGTYTATAAGVSNANYKLPSDGLSADFTIYPSLSDLWNAIGDKVWTGYGEKTGVISYRRGGEGKYTASFMGGTYTFDVPFDDMVFNPNSDVNNFPENIYAFDIQLPGITGMSSETLGIRFQDGKIIGISSAYAGISEMKPESGVSSWEDLQNAMRAGGNIKLENDITAGSEERVLTVPYYSTAVLDLNGHTIDRALTDPAENGGVIVNNGTLAILDSSADGTGKITGGSTTGNGGGVLNNGALTVYGGGIAGNKAAGAGGGVYNSSKNTSLYGFWMTGGLIDGNTASSYPAIGGDVIFNSMASVQIRADGTTVSAAAAKAGMANYSYIKPMMPTNDNYKILTELYTALGDEVWTGYGEQTGVISYSRGDEPNEFRASFMGGTYDFDVPFGDIASVEKTDNGDGTYTYRLTVPLPASTGLTSERLEVTVRNGKITGLVSKNAGLDMGRENEVSTWSGLLNALAKGGVIKLSANITAGSGDTALTVPSGKTVVLDLNGFTIDRALTDATDHGSVIVNDGTLAIQDSSEGKTGKITRGSTTGNGGGVLNHGALTVYGGEITGNHADGIGGGVYNSVTGPAQGGFWMTGGIIDRNTAGSCPAIGGEVTFNTMAAVQMNADGTTVSAATARTGMASYSYIKPVMPDNETFRLLTELYTALGDEVWTGYGEQTGVISYSRGDEPNEFKASFMGGAYSFDVPFGGVTSAEKTNNDDGTYTYKLSLPLPASTGLASETLEVTVRNGKITGLASENAGLEMGRESGVSTWSALADALAKGGVIKLTRHVTVGSGDTALTVPSGKTVVLDLNGYTIDRALTGAKENGSVIVNDGTLAVLDSSATGNGKITGGNTTGYGGGILNHGALTLYGGEISGNKAAGIGGGVYTDAEDSGTARFWMTGGVIEWNEANSYPAIGGGVTFNSLAAVQVARDGTTVSAATARTGMASYSYIKPVMPDSERFELLAELYKALGYEVWTGYGEQTGVISYSRGDEPNEFRASFMGGTYDFDVPFGDIASVKRADNGDGTYTYTLEVPLPAYTGLTSERLEVTVRNGKITKLASENAGLSMSEAKSDITTWVELKAAMEQGGVIKLSANITAGSGDTALTVPSGKTVVLDLNGFTIDRALTDATDHGSVIVNDGTLAIQDSSEGKTGKITRGNTTGNGGGVLNHGTLTLYGGEITGNRAAGTGGGVYSTAGASFWMTGGTVDGNSAESYPAIGGGVTFNSLATVKVDGGNTVSVASAMSGMETYRYVQPDMPDTVTEFAAGTAERSEVLAELYKALGDKVMTGYGASTGVISYSAVKDRSAFHASFMGGAYAFDVPFDGITKASKDGNQYTLEVPLPAFTGLAYETLTITLDNGEIAELKSEKAGLSMSEAKSDITTWAQLQKAMADGGVIELAGNITAGGTDTALTVPSGKTVVLDLNGFAVSRGLTSAAENGSVIVNHGTLAIQDSGTGGQITGGSTTGNGGGILNHGTLTLYGGEITGNGAATGGGVYNSVTNTETVGFWMTGGKIDGNTADSYPAIGGNVTFHALAAVQVDPEGRTVSAAEAQARMAGYGYVRPIMPSMAELEKAYEEEDPGESGDNGNNNGSTNSGRSGGSSSGTNLLSSTTTTTSDNASHPDASTTNGTATVTTTKNPDGSTTARTTGTATKTGADGSTTEVKSESTTTTKSNRDGTTTVTTTASESAVTTAADGTKTVTETRTEAKETLNRSGNGTVEAKTTETVKDASGNVTSTTVTERKGTVTTAGDGTKTTTTTNTAVTTDAAGNETTVVTTETAAETKDGSTGKIVSDENGKVLSVEAKVIEAAAESAAKSGGAVTLPVTVTAAQSAAEATPVEITVPQDAESVRVEIPVEDAKPGTVAVIVREDGSEEIVKTSTNGENGVVLTLEGGASVKIVDNTKTFNDVSGDEWYADNVAWASSREIMRGVGNDTFAPNAETSRAMVTQILFNLDGRETDGTIPSFADVSASDWYADSIAWAVSNGIARGEGASFGANNPVTREQLAVMLYNYAGVKGYEVSAKGEMSRFADNDGTSSWAADAIAWAVGLGILNGTTDADGAVVLDPQGSATRAQVTAMIERFARGRQNNVSVTNKGHWRIRS